jgi:4-nitrophenyl phosphatase
LAERVATGAGSPGNVVMDLDGVVYLASSPIPGAGGALDEVAGAGYRLVFATNNSSKSAPDVAARIEAMTGFPVDPAAVVTSGVAAATMVRADDVPAFVLGEGGLAATLRARGIEVTADPRRARSVVVGLDRGLTYERLRDATTAVLGGARLIATNPDPTFPTPDGLWPGGGAIAEAVAAAAGRRPENAGKPFAPMQRAVAALLGPGPTWMVGDRPETDMAFGRAAGWTTVLVMTGVTSDRSQISTVLAPDHVIDSITGLPGLLHETED